MVGSRHLLVFLAILRFIPLFKGQSCCERKIVSGAVAENAGLVGTYILKRDDKDDKDSNCFDGCIYFHEERKEEEYCFKSVEKGAIIKEENCEAEAKTTAAKTEEKTTAAKTEEKTTAAKTEAKTTAVKTEAKTTAVKTEAKTTTAKTEAK